MKNIIKRECVLLTTKRKKPFQGDIISFTLKDYISEKRIKILDIELTVRNTSEYERDNKGRDVYALNIDYIVNMEDAGSSDCIIESNNILVVKTNVEFELPDGYNFYKHLGRFVVFIGEADLDNRIYPKVS